MSRHSLGAYRIVLMMRSARTLLVEGETDRAVLHRLMLDVNVEGMRPNVDTPAILSDPKLTGLGNKSQLEVVAADVGPVDNFLALVDREWENFRQAELELEDATDGLLPAGCLIRTYGHSIENYFFEVEGFKSFLRRQFATHLTAGALRLIEERFSDICCMSLAYSLAARKFHLISRLENLLAREDLLIDEDRFSLSPAFGTKLVARGVDAVVAADFARAVEENECRIRVARVPLRIMKWASHGHIGLHTIWVGIAKILQTLGAGHDACDQVERGLRMEKLRHGADVLATVPCERRPLEWIVRWLHRIEANDGDADPGQGVFRATTD